MRVATRPAFALTIALALGALAACGNAADGSAAPEAAATPVAASSPAASPGRIRIQGLGLDITDPTGTATTLKFEEVSQADAIAAVNAATGAAPQMTTNNDCPSGPTSFADYPNGLQLVFVDGKFQGWTLDQPGIYTENEFGVGVSRTVLDGLDDFTIDPTSTLGVEFYFQGVNGFLASTAPDAPVESLYAGLTCFFR